MIFIKKRKSRCESKFSKKKHWLDILEILKFGGARKVTHMLELLDENRQLDP